jgi:hypothetical protein
MKDESHVMIPNGSSEFVAIASSKNLSCASTLASQNSMVCPLLGRVKLRHLRLDSITKVEDVESVALAKSLLLKLGEALFFAVAALAEANKQQQEENARVSFIFVGWAQLEEAQRASRKR